MVNDTLKNVCKIGQGADCCRYLLAGASGFECGKLDKHMRATLDAKVITMVAKGDNCEGKYNSELNK